MSETFLNGRVTLWAGDCREVLASLEEASIDACVTDPPYHLASIAKRYGSPNSAPVRVDNIDATNNLKAAYARQARGFMGRAWDGGDIAFDPDTWRAVYRVLKPGAHLLTFGAPKNFGFMQVAIAHAGFEVRDVICWLFGSGFPKSHDVSKAIDRLAGVEREVVGYDASKARPNKENFAKRTDRQPDTGASAGWKDNGATITAPTTDAARQWEGWGTALKPACEMVILARKPLIGTVAENVLRYGTGAINIDGCRIACDDKTPAPVGQYVGSAIGPVGHNGIRNGQSDHLGRWPANVALSWPEDQYVLGRDATPEQKRELYRWLSENT